ncbi:epoxide hydrolase [Ferrovibrio sp.]|uniref:epoxide hydrolase family protein n=1 Tax=Ferrovibrio sp. TaxID=1917215 RepID=UPI0025B895E9|nr:epoxide hydrolase [Ferrovibrio sp.]MBX3456114.1 alpha/beta fold hydrolase [Ferrovibrio sp.]
MSAQPPIHQPMPFRINVPDSAIADLHTRLDRTRLPQQPRDAGWRYGSNVDYMRSLLRHWRHDFDWRHWEARLNAWPQFRVSLPRNDGHEEQVLHYLVAHGKSAAPRPLLLLHGWPGAVYEFIEMLERLTDPARFGGNAADACTVICPSLPGYGYSTPLHAPIGPRAIAALYRGLMVDVLGFERFFVQAGDWGSIVASWLGIDYADHVAALHLNMVPLRPPVTTALSDEEKAWAAETKQRHAMEGGYFAIQSTKPTTLGYGLSDSPAGLAGWIVEKFHGRPNAPAAKDPPFSMDAMLAIISLYWFSDTAATATWLYHAAVARRELAMGKTDFCAPPTAFLLPPWDLVPPSPPGWLARGYNVVQQKALPRGGHFVAMEQPDALLADMTDFFHHRTL